jgi:predicted O-methyltransferase YrrM
MTPEERWAAVDDYLTTLLVRPSPALDAALDSSKAAGLPMINVSAPQGKFLHLLALIRGAKRILEIGTLGGYSTIWLAQALGPDGSLITLEFDPKHAQVAQANIGRARLDAAVETIVGPASDSLSKLVAAGTQAFDFIFIDADKESYPDYLKWAMKLSRRGTIIVADNVIRKGAVIDAKSNDARVQAVRRYNELVAADPRLTATALQTVGSKGYDGFTIAVVLR